MCPLDSHWISSTRWTVFHFAMDLRTAQVTLYEFLSWFVKPPLLRCRRSPELTLRFAGYKVVPSDVLNLFFPSHFFTPISLHSRHMVVVEQHTNVPSATTALRSPCFPLLPGCFLLSAKQDQRTWPVRPGTRQPKDHRTFLSLQTPETTTMEIPRSSTPMATSHPSRITMSPLMTFTQRGPLELRFQRRSQCAG